MPDGDVFEVAFQQDCHGEEAFCVYHFEQDGGDPATKTQEVALRDAIVGDPWFTTHLAPRGAAEWRVNAIRVYRIRPTRGFPTTFPVTKIGTEAGVALPCNMSVMHRHYSTDPNPVGFGRNYWPGCSGASEIDGNLTDLHMTLEQNMATQLIVPKTNDGATWNSGVFSRLTQVFNKSHRIDIMPTIRMHRNRTPK